MLDNYKILAKFPIYMGVTDQEVCNDIFMDQKWVICQNCFCLQLKELVPLNILYSQNHSLEAVGATWQNHHLVFSKKIINESPSSICEIGGSHGFLAKQIISSLPNVKYLMIEPDPTFRDNRIKTIKSFFEDNPSIIKGYECIVHSHVLEHSYDPVGFLKKLNENMLDSSVMHMSIPNINQILKNFGSNGLNFEHTFFLSIENLEYMAAKTGFQIINVQNYLNHSYFVTLKKKKIIKINPDYMKEQNRLNSKNFDLLWDGLTEFVRQTKLNISKNPKIATYIFGAHIFTQSLHYLGLDECDIVGVLDNALGKKGKRLYGTPYEVFQPEIIKELKNVRVILKAANYQIEIKEQLVKINKNVEIIE